MPRGNTAPNFSYLCLFASMSTRSLNSSTASSRPLTLPRFTPTRSITWKAPSGRTLDFLLRTSCRLSSKSSSEMVSRPARAAPSAALLSNPRRSAGVNADVSRATLWKSSCQSAARVRPATPPRRMSSLPAASGNLKSMRCSKRPVRSRASSSTSGLFVAARNKTPEVGSKPSMRANRAFRVASWSTFAEVPDWLASSNAASWPCPRAPPKVSISSMKIMHGARRRASAKSLIVIDVPTPEYGDCRKSLPLRARKGTPAADATARAAKVLPVPVSPQNNTPFGGTAPTREYRCGSRTMLTSSSSCAFTSGLPLKSSKETRAASPSSMTRNAFTLAYAFPTSSSSSSPIAPAPKSWDNTFCEDPDLAAPPARASAIANVFFLPFLRDHMSSKLCDDDLLPRLPLPVRDSSSSSSPCWLRRAPGVEPEFSAPRAAEDANDRCSARRKDSPNGSFNEIEVTFAESCMGSMRHVHAASREHLQSAT
mmetsp:Transcript_115557/g.326672  ORF Transcript_115557/g.326672 Transcript_115557/m.326672 type:complete len:482 (+) Transcript_115557:1341-2786(+)